MSNIQFAVIASPGTHKDLCKKINAWKYKVEGKHFTGYKAPYITEIKLYDIRVPEEIEERVCRDLGLYDFGEHSGGAVATWHYRLLGKVFKFVRRFTPWKPITRAEGPNEYSLGTWFYTMSLGKLKRQKMKCLTGTKREVM